MDDHDLLAQIGELVEEERRLRASAGGGRPLGDAERGRLDELEVRLDQCWDLLRRREAREEFGQNPDQEHVQPAEVVEHYQQ